MNLKEIVESLIEFFLEAGDLSIQLREKGLIKKNGAVKIIGTGELKESLNVHAHKFSRSAQVKIEKSGGKAVNL